MTYIVSGGVLNSTHSLANNFRRSGVIEHCSNIVTPRVVEFVISIIKAKVLKDILCWNLTGIVDCVLATFL